MREGKGQSKDHDGQRVLNAMAINSYTCSNKYSNRLAYYFEMLIAGLTQIVNLFHFKISSVFESKNNLPLQIVIVALSTNKPLTQCCFLLMNPEIS